MQKSKSYLTHVPVRSHHEADILSRENSWNILECIRGAGAHGIAADEIVRDLDLPPTLVYTTIKELRRLEFISIVPRNKGNKERKKRYLCERPTWGKYRIDPAFMNAIAYEGVTKSLGEKLNPMIENFSNLFEEFRARNKLKPFAPIPEQSRICPVCNRNHEATEFIFAIMLATVDTFLNESEEFRQLLVDKGYAR